MSATKSATIADDSVLEAELQEAVDRLVKGVRDPEAMRKACDRMDRMRDEMRRRTGEVEIAVDLIREVRDAR